jgi:SPP1 gp7 family putative phage head morphogenesis protein
VPLWRQHVVVPAITRALAGRGDAEDTKQPLYTWFVNQHARIIQSQSRLQQGTLGIKANAHSPRVQTALEKGRNDARELITKAAKDLEDDLNDVLLDPDNFGLRHEEIRDLLIDRGNVSASRAELIARDQTLKVNASVARAGHEDAGFDKYIWSTSMDERVRPEHEVLEGQIFSYSIGSPEGNPGDPVQCRCVALPYEGDDTDED